MKNLARSSTLFLALILLSALALPAQTRDVFLLKWTPLPLLDPQRGNLLLNAEVRPIRMLGLEASVGIPFPYLEALNWNSDKTQRSYSILRSEIRAYPWKGMDFYFALEAFRIRDRYRTGPSGYYNVNQEYIIHQGADIEKFIWGITSKAGIVIPLANRLRLDVYSGFGMRDRVQLVYNVDSGFVGEPPIDWNATLSVGRRVLPHFSAGVKLAFVIGSVSEK